MCCDLYYRVRLYYECVFQNRFLNVYQPLYNGYTASNAFIFVVLKHLADWSSVVQKSSHFTLYLSKYDLAYA